MAQTVATAKNNPVFAAIKVEARSHCSLCVDVYEDVTVVTNAQLTPFGITRHMDMVSLHTAES